jgi:hypothetical protein
MLMSIFGALTFVAAVLGLVISLAAVVFLLATRRVGAALRVGLYSLAGLALYFVLLAAVSVTSAEKVLGINDEKKFCAADCDLAFSVTNVTKTETLGDPPNQSKAQGIYNVVNVKIRSDAVRVTMQFNDPIDVQAVDKQGREYAYSPQGQRAFDLSKGITSTLVLPWVHELAPGASSSRDIVFDLPADAQDPALVIIEGGWPTTFVIGDENSLFHKKTKIRLTP